MLGYLGDDEPRIHEHHPSHVPGREIYPLNNGETPIICSRTHQTWSEKYVVDFLRCFFGKTHYEVLEPIVKPNPLEPFFTTHSLW